VTTTPQAKGQGFLSKLGDRAANVNAILAVFGVILYAVLRVAYSIFYNGFGLYPDDLGLGYLDLLVQSAVGIFLLLLAMCFVTLLLVTLSLGLGLLRAQIRAEAAKAEAANLTAKAEAARAEAANLTAKAEAAKAEAAEPEAANLTAKTNAAKATAAKAEAAKAEAANLAAKADAAKAKGAEARGARAEAAKAKGAKAEAAAAEGAKAGKAEAPQAHPRSRLSGVLNLLGVLGLIIFGIVLYGGLAVFVLHRFVGIQVPSVLVVLGDVSAALLCLGMVGFVGQAFKAIVDRLSRRRGRPWRNAIIAASGHSRRQWRLATITVASLVFVIATASLLWKARYDKSQVLSGHAAAFTVLGFPITSWRAEDATISWTGPSVATDLQPLADRCVLYLGESGGSAFFYRAGTRQVPGQVLRISMLDVVVHTGPHVCNR
jgi:hypothetical protein